jgi:hypothetical protein
MATYELEVDDAIWERWASSLEPGTAPDRRIADLLIADLEGRVGDGEAPASSGYACPMCSETFDSLDRRDAHLIEDHDLAPI